VAHFRAPNKKVNQPCPTHVTQISLLWTHFEHHFWHGKHHQIRFNEGAPFTNKLWQIMRPKIKSKATGGCSLRRLLTYTFIHPIQVPDSSNRTEPNRQLWTDPLICIICTEVGWTGNTKRRCGPCGIINSQRYLFVMRTRGCQDSGLVQQSPRGSLLNLDLELEPVLVFIFVLGRTRTFCSIRGQHLLDGQSSCSNDDRGPTTELCQR